MKPWLVIGGITFVVALFSGAIRFRDISWATRLDRPRWLVFEPAIPVIWTSIFACGAWSATLVWNHHPGGAVTWLWMGLYLLLEVVTVAYIPLTLRSRHLSVGMLLGSVGFVLSIILALGVRSISPWAALLLLPYVFWSPIGTYTTWQMAYLNPDAT